VRRPTRATLWIAVLALGATGVILGLTSFVQMAVWNEWAFEAVMGSSGAVCGGVGCTIAAISGIRSNGVRPHKRSERSIQR